MPAFNNPFYAAYDPVTCLAVMRQLLDRAYTWRNELAADIHEPDFGLIPSEHHGVLQDDNMYTYTYRDASCGHAAVGAIAPFFEGVFRHEFASLRVAFGDRPHNNYHRWKLDADDFWTPSVVSNNGTRGENPDIARGTKQLMKALAIEAHFPPTMENTVSALFAFRNCALHNGYEWPLDTRHRFRKLVEDRNWDVWFPLSTWGDDPWIASLTDAFVHICLDIAGDTVKGFRAARLEWTGDKGVF